MVKALVVDGDNTFQNLLSKLLGSYGIEVIGRASSLQQLELLCQATSPDVVLVGLGSEGSEEKEKLDALSAIKEINPSVKLIVLSILESFEFVSQGQHGLIDAYVAKGSTASEIVSTIKEVAQRGSQTTAED